jgi:hypothetical protein
MAKRIAIYALSLAAAVSLICAAWLAGWLLVSKFAPDASLVLGITGMGSLAVVIPLYAAGTAGLNLFSRSSLRTYILAALVSALLALRHAFSFSGGSLIILFDLGMISIAGLSAAAMAWLHWKFTAVLSGER